MVQIIEENHYVPTREPLTELRQYLANNIRASGKNPAGVIAGFVGAWIAFALIAWALPLPNGLSPEGKMVLAIVAWASIMWVSEAMPVGVTGIAIPLLLILTKGIAWTDGNPPMAAAFAGFTNEVVWLCLFAFIVGAFLQLLKLDRRIALAILDTVKASTAGRVVWGFFGVNLVLALFVPAANARSATLLSIVDGVAKLLGDTEEERAARKMIVIQSLVYGAMICGMVIMTAHLPNLILVDLFGKSNFRLDYLHWSLLQFPYLGMFVLTQLWLRFHFRAGRVPIAGGYEKIHAQHQSMGPMSRAEWLLLILLAGGALMFALGKGSPILQLHQYPLGIIGLVGIIVLFIPGLFPFTWKEVQDRTIWGTFLLLGGALTMTSAMSKSGLADWLASLIQGAVVGQTWWAVLLIMMIGTHVIRLGMLSNVAAVAMLAPILFAMAPKVGLHPVAFTMLVADTDSFAYILPTQITAAVIAYSAGHFSTADYAKAGWVSVLIAIAYAILVMAPWYAYLGIPVWDASAPWPF
jgi:solute carrier family 13 (sodium-dependent dicarboxylate transporter), member 2/3/5